MEAKEFSYEKALLFFAKSKYADLFGVALVIAIAIASGYLSTNLAKYVDWGPITAFIPLGVISVINVGISMMSTRLTGRLSNVGNVLGIINTALSGAIDYILGNKAAIITYPVTFIVYTFAIRRWQNSERGKAMEPPTGTKGQLIIGGIVAGSFAFSLIANYVGYGGKTSVPVLDHAVVFGLSLSANILNALKLTMQWQFWLLYNAVQCIKALTQATLRTSASTSSTSSTAWQHCCCGPEMAPQPRVPWRWRKGVVPWRTSYRISTQRYVGTHNR